MSISLMVEGWNECDEIAVNAPRVNMSVSSMGEVLEAANLQHLDASGDCVPAERVGVVVDLLEGLEASIVGDTAKFDLRVRAVNLWTVFAFAKARGRGVQWA